MITLVRDHIKSCAASYPTKVAYIDGDSTITWEAVDQRSTQLANGLATLGAKKGDVVAMLSFDHIEMIEHLFACAKLGTVRVAVNRGYSPREMAHVLRDSNARYVIVDARCSHHLKDHLKELKAEGRHFIGFGSDHGLETDYETLIADSGSSEEWAELGADDPYVISFTSGTTGLPKGVIMRHGGVREMLCQLPLTVGLKHEDTWLNPTMMAWATFMMNIMSLANGMTTVLQGGDFDAERFLVDCSRHKVTSVLMVPTILQRVIRVYQSSKDAYDLSYLRLITYGSSPATPKLIRETLATFGVELIQLYGLTEFCAWATYLRHGDHLKALNGHEHILGSCGKAAPYCEVSIRDEHGNAVKRGEMGELWLRSSTLMKGYLNLDELTSKVLQDGWLKSHDIGMQDEEGYIYLTDRKNFLIITGAANVYPSIVESTIAEMQSVAEVSVVGAPHEEWGEAVVAMVAPKPGASVTAAEIIEFCRTRLAKWEVPKFIELVDELPKGPTMKVLKNQIKRRYQDNHGILPWYQ